MSTGADCQFIERKPNQWFYRLQEWPYGETEEYDEQGPFPSFEKAQAHLDKHNANPGGFTVTRYGRADPMMKVTVLP